MSKLVFVTKNPFDRSIICRILKNFKFSNILGVMDLKGAISRLAQVGEPGPFFWVFLIPQGTILWSASFVVIFSLDRPFWISTTGLVRLLNGFIWKKLQQSWRFTESFLKVSRSPKKKAPVLGLDGTEIWPLLGPGTPKIFENFKLSKIWHIILRSKGFFTVNTNFEISRKIN